ncbi:TRAF-like family protein [Corchorus olitorius]|uniref:TRAF-like family protein n=1 Tax=Corchorus olitorius TaxID=93759 RepID=A0A1R3KYM7_9ROSI|nr:TRAF-like family protein [Corchorus olitorius]
MIIIIVMEVATSWRKEAPAHYLLKIDTFSSVVSSIKIQYYESCVFEACGYKWRLYLFPKTTNNEIPYVYLSLGISEHDNNHLPPNWEINAMVRFFVYNHQKDKYLTIQYRKLCRFHEINKFCASNCLPYDTFINPINGYLRNDSCVFGVEVFVHIVKDQAKRETLSMISKQPNVPNTFTWKIVNFSELTGNSRHFSHVFPYAGYQWKFQIYPNGYVGWEGKSVSLFLTLHDADKYSSDWKMYVRHKLRIRNQVSANHKEMTWNSKFCAANSSWGWHNFLPLPI